MCGVAGLVSQEPEQHIQKMLQAIEHRGRDDEGVWNSGVIDDQGQAVCFGHRRLAIIDTSSAGHQPMLSHDKRLVVVLNGEIYNYRELREQLAAKGHHFRTQTDTEVLLASWAEWGRDCLLRLNGMFAFALWDEKERTLTLARDHVGIKPLYYAQCQKPDHEGPISADSGLIFASEIKAILASGFIKPDLNIGSLHQFLTFLWVPHPNTLFKRIKSLPPGHVLTFAEGKVRIDQWWDVSFEQIEEGRSEAWFRDRVLETLDRVVKMEMIADVPLGSFLSGGIDSSAIVAMMKNHSNGRPISTYTIGIQAEDLHYDIIPDDLRWARIISQELRTNSNEIILNPQVAELLPKLVYHMDQPVADPAIITSYLVSQAARQTLRVLLSGMGADEVFAGYPRLLAMKLASEIEFFPSFVTRPLLATVATMTPGGLPGRFTAVLRNAKKFARSASLDFEDRYLGYGTYFTDAAKQNLYSEDLRDATRELDAYCEHRRYFAQQQHADPLNRLLYVDLKTFLPCLNLAYTDKTSMAANLEVRVPFLNREIIEMTARMPPDLKLRGYKRKYILKRAMEGVLPHDVVWRKKAGFGAPIRSWLRGPLRPLVADLLSAETVKRRGLFRHEEVRRIIDANLSGREDYNLMVFQLLTLELWYRAFLEKG